MFRERLGLSTAAGLPVGRDKMEVNSGEGEGKAGKDDMGQSLPRRGIFKNTACPYVRERRKRDCQSLLKESRERNEKMSDLIDSAESVRVLVGEGLTGEGRNSAGAAMVEKRMEQSTPATSGTTWSEEKSRD